MDLALAANVPPLSDAISQREPPTPPQRRNRKSSCEAILSGL